MSISDPVSAMTRVTLPNDALSGQTIQRILEATDTGSPALTRYQRVVVTR